MVDDIFQAIRQYLTADYIALLSVIITVFIFILSRKAELKYKIHEDKKAQYAVLISLMEKIFTDYMQLHNKKLTADMKKLFFNAGSALLLYGSKKLYRKYLFFRDFSANPLIPKCKYYEENLIVYVMADILRTMRKEVGLRNFNNIPSHEALGFFINDITNSPIANVKAYNATFRIKMIKFELFMINLISFTALKGFYYRLIMPAFGFITIIIKYLVLLPLGKIIKLLFPHFTANIQNDN